MFRVVIHKLASSPVHLDLEEGTLATEAICRVLRSYVPPDYQEGTEEGTSEGWRLRARRVMEEGRWWSENDINEYSDRKFEFEVVIDSKLSVSYTGCR